MFICQACGHEFEAEHVGRRDECSACGADLHACRQCRFYEPGAHNDCREPQAELVTGKEAANFCDYFEPVSGRPVGPVKAGKAEAEKMWEELFGKK